jgi:HK97 family phage major capsid protein
MKEVRNLETSQAEVRALKDSRTVEGYAIVFNSESRDLGGFNEVIKPEAVDGVLGNADVLALLNHDQSRGLLARSTNGEGTLDLSVDNKGVRYKFDAPKTALGDELLEGISRNDIRTSSFTFVVGDGGQKWEKRDDGTYLRTITSFANILDVSPVFREAYPDTTAARRSLEEVRSLEGAEDNKPDQDGENEQEISARKAEEVKQEQRKALNQSKQITMNKKFSEMTALELTDKVAELREANDAIYASAGEGALTAEQRKETEKNVALITEGRNALEAIGKEQPVKMKVGDNKQKSAEKRFNLLTAIKNRAEGRAMTEVEKQVIDAGKAEMRASGINAEGDIVLGTEGEGRAINVGTATEGQEVVTTEKDNILAPLRDALVTVKAGATYLTGLTGNFDIPAYAGSTAAWKGETAAAGDGEGAFSDISFSPLRITAYVDISKLFLNQDSVSAEALLKQDIVDAVADRLESTIFSEDAAVAGVSPAGLFAGGDPSINGAAAWANVVAQETALGNANALRGNPSYIMGASARGIYKITEKASGTGLFLMGESNTMNGYPVHVTNHMVSGLQTAADEYGVAFANWSDLIVAQWGGVDLTVDPYTKAADGQVRLVVNAYFDAKFRRAASISLASVK